MGLTSSPSEIWGKSVKGFASYDRTYKQTNKQTEITSLYIDYRVCLKKKNNDNDNDNEW